MYQRRIPSAGSSRQLTAGVSHLGTTITCPRRGNAQVPLGSHLTHQIYSAEGRFPSGLQCDEAGDALSRLCNT